jgi:hypothetical protein
MLKFMINNNLKAEPVMFGLRVGNLIYLAGMAIIALILYGNSGYLGLSRTVTSIIGISLIIAAFFFLKKMERNPDYGYMDKMLARLFQPKAIESSDMKQVILKRKQK